MNIGLIQVKEEGRGFLRGGRAAPRDFSRAKPKGNPKRLDAKTLTSEYPKMLGQRDRHKGRVVMGLSMFMLVLQAVLQAVVEWYPRGPFIIGSEARSQEPGAGSSLSLP